jgi:hypothetical protein
MIILRKFFDVFFLCDFFAAHKRIFTSKDAIVVQKYFKEDFSIEIDMNQHLSGEFRDFST